MRSYLESLKRFGPSDKHIKAPACLCISVPFDSSLDLDDYLGMNCPSSHSLFLRSNGSLVCWDDKGQLKELQAFDRHIDYAYDVYLGPVYNNIRKSLHEGEMPFPEFCANCCVLMTNHPTDNLASQHKIETFQIEPSMGCQLDCPGCIKRSERKDWVPKRPSGHMTLDPEVLYKIVIDLKSAGIQIKKFDFQGSGEPLLNKRVWEMCTFLSEHYPSSIISVCTHANAEFRPEMVTSGVNEILFAIDGVDQKSYEPWRVNGNFEQAYQFMRSFSLEAAAKAPHIRRIWKYVLFSHNDSEEQLLKAQELALNGKLTGIRFVVTQLGPASNRVHQISDVPRLEIKMDAYLIEVAQLISGQESLRVAIEEGIDQPIKRWADFQFHSIIRLFNARPKDALKHIKIVEAFIDLISPLRADQFGIYDWLIANTIDGIEEYISSVAEAWPLSRPIPLSPTVTTVASMRDIVRTVEVDDKFYLSTYPDVARAVASGELASAALHYRKIGYCEARLPRKPIFDAAWYMNAYPDVAAAHSSGEVPDLLTHFMKYGYREGREPFCGFAS